MYHLRFYIFFLLLLAAADAGAGVFDIVRSLPVGDRFAKTQEIYNNEVKGKDSVSAIASITELSVMAREMDDKALACFSVSLLADQYARARGANDYSVQLHRRAIALAENNGLPLLTGICNYRLGRYYYSFKNYPFAFEYLLRADNFFQEVGYREVPDIDEILFFIGSIYYETGNYDKAESYLENIHALKKVNNYVQKQSLNTLALINRQQGDTAQALAYFQKTLEVAVATPDSAWIGISYSNIGSLYFSMRQYDKAYPFLEEGSSLSIANKQWGDAHKNLLLLARIELIRNRAAIALDRINSAIRLQPLFFTINGRKNLYETQAEYYKKTGQHEQALVIQNLLLLVKDSLSASRDEQAYKRIQLRMETEKHLADIDKLAGEARALALKSRAVIMVLGLLVVVLVLLYSRYRLKTRNAAAILLQKQRLLETEKLRAEEKLKYATQLLQNFTENTRQKNELIEQFATELDRLKSSLPGHPVYEERLKNFEKLVRSSILTNQEWTDFRALFDKVHKGFFSRLAEKFPGLSLTDTRLVSLVKLGLGTAEMANMLGVNLGATEQSLLTLREKLYPGTGDLSVNDIVKAI